MTTLTVDSKAKCLYWQESETCVEIQAVSGNNKFVRFDDADPCAGVTCGQCQVCDSGNCNVDPASIGTSCDDGDLSTINDVCVTSGNCEGTAKCTPTSCGVFQRHGQCNTGTWTCDCDYPWSGDDCGTKNECN